MQEIYGRKHHSNKCNGKIKNLIKSRVRTNYSFFSCCTSVSICYSTAFISSLFSSALRPRVGPGYPHSAFAPPCPFTFSSFALYYLFPFLVHFTCFLLLSIRSLSTRIVPLRFQAWGQRRRPNLGLVCFVLWLCHLYCLVKIYSGILLYLV